jgi:hypothetical protein
MPCAHPRFARSHLDAVGQGAGGYLRAWLQARHMRWPAMANPHLLINRSTGGGLTPVSRGYVQAAMRRAGITAADLRADRLLGEAHASSGDPLQLTHLFGISDPTAIRYCAELGQRGYDEHQAQEGAAGSAGRTESTSASR